MVRTLLRVPRMFTKEDLSRIDPRVPPDYEEKATEFWDYVNERVSAMSGRLKKIYLESAGVVGKHHLDMLKVSDPRQYGVVKNALDAGAELVDSENPELVLETFSWMQKMQELLSTNQDEKEGMATLQTISEFLQESIKERDEFVKKTIETSLKDGELGILFMDMSREIEFSPEIRVVITCPFRPNDYLNSWLAGLRARDRSKAAGEEKEADRAEKKGQTKDK